MCIRDSSPACYYMFPYVTLTFPLRQSPSLIYPSEICKKDEEDFEKIGTFKQNRLYFATPPSGMFWNMRKERTFESFFSHSIFTSTNPADYLLGKGSFINEMEDTDVAEVGECARDDFVVVFEG